MILTIIILVVIGAGIAGSVARDHEHSPEKYTVTEVASGLKRTGYMLVFPVFIFILILIRTGFFERNF